MSNGCAGVDNQLDHLLPSQEQAKLRVVSFVRRRELLRRGVMLFRGAAIAEGFADGGEVEVKCGGSRLLFQRRLPHRARVREAIRLDEQHRVRECRRGLVERDRLAHAPRRDSLRGSDRRVARRLLERDVPLVTPHDVDPRRGSFAFRLERGHALQVRPEHVDPRRADRIDPHMPASYAIAVDVARASLAFANGRRTGEGLHVEVDVRGAGLPARVARAQHARAIDLMEEDLDEGLDLRTVADRLHDRDLFGVSDVMRRRNDALERDAR